MKNGRGWGPRTKEGGTVAAKCLIVTGAAGGIGASTVEVLAQRGINVIAVDLDESGLLELGRRVSGNPGEVTIRVVDVAEEQQVSGMVEEAISRWGRLDGIFNNAGIEGPTAPITRYPTEEFDRVMRVNTRSVFLGMKYAIPALLQSGGGVIVNTASNAGMIGYAGVSAYISSKHSVIGLTKAVALEVADKNIRVNAIAPGPVDTRMVWAVGEGMAPGDKAKQKIIWESLIPVGRLGQRDEIACLAAWLLLDAPGYLTGALLPIDGGQTTGPVPEPMNLP